MVRIGLIGCGRITQIFHMKALLSLPEVFIAAIAEMDPARREEAHAQCPEAQTFPDYRELLQQSNVDAVVICLPSGMHARSAIEAFESGKHVYLEKPIAMELNEAEAVTRAWRRSGRIGMIGFNFRFNPLYREARERIESGTLGALISARSVFSAAARTLPSWKRSRSTGGGVLLDLASHHLDLARYLFNTEIKSVRATVRSMRSEGDSATIEAVLETGIAMQSFFSMSSIEEHSFEIYGVKGRLSLDRVLSKQVEVTRPMMPYDRIHRIWSAFAALDPKRLLRSPWEPSFASALGAFAMAVRTGSPVKPDLDDGYRSLAAVIAAEESAARGGPVLVSGAERMA